jgi:hypothetical protein
MASGLRQYYIEKQLILFYKNKSLTRIIVDRTINTFYLPIFDGDEQILKEIEEDYFKYALMPRKTPRIIFKQNTFLSPKWEEKYSVVVEEQLMKMNKKWMDLDEIHKCEKRYV